MMKQLLYIPLFLLFSCKIFAQTGLDYLTANIEINNYSKKTATVYDTLSFPAYSKTVAGLSFQYNGIYDIKKTSLYILAGARYYYRNVKDWVYYEHSIGVGKKWKKDSKKPIYTGIGVGLNTMGYRFFANGNFVFPIKNTKICLSPEISYHYITRFPTSLILTNSHVITVGVGIGIGTYRIAYFERESKKTANLTHFYIDYLLVNVNKYINNKSNIYNKADYQNININYKFSNKQLISPELGVGFISTRKNNIYNSFNDVYVSYKDILPYIKIGLAFESEKINKKNLKKFSIISNVDLIKGFNINAIGYSYKIGVKYAIIDKIGLSISYNGTKYEGLVDGYYKVVDINNNIIANETKHEALKKGLLKGISLGIHF